MLLGSGVCASTCRMKQMHENLLEKQKQPGAPEKQRDGSLSSSRVVGRDWRTGEMFQSNRYLKSQKNKMKVKEPKEAIDAVEKRSAMCWNEKRKLERTWLHRRWFPVGC